jgi:hypothetical protein
LLNKKEIIYEARLITTGQDSCGSKTINTMHLANGYHSHYLIRFEVSELQQHNLCDVYFRSTNLP